MRTQEHCETRIKEFHNMKPLKNQKQNLNSIFSSSLFSGLTIIALALQAVVGSASAAESARPDREAIHAALEACATENNIAKPQPGQRPSEADRQVIETCMTAKGFSPPPHGRGRGPGHRRDAEESASKVSQ
jgi:hypothetical protein